MVLIRILAMVVLAGCGQSLFDSHGSVDGGGGGGDSSVPAVCPTPCLADAAGDFDGSDRGSTGLWRYLDDMRTRAWTPMAGDINEMTGAGMNRITTCAKHGNAAACSDLPGALLISSSGATSLADPALELTSNTSQNMQLTLRVRVPSGAPDQIVRLYRNSREDTLVTAIALPGVTLDKLIKVDALAGDRFLLAIAPMAMGATDVAVQLFANPTGALFPAECVSAYSFETPSVMTTMTSDLGHTNAMTSYDFDTNPPEAVVRGAGPFPELGMALQLVESKYSEATTVTDRIGDTTMQMWVKIDTMPPQGTGAWAFADEDLDVAGGLGVVIFDDTGTSPMVQFSTCTQGSPPGPLLFVQTAVAYPMPTAWHFLRVVHKDGTVTACIDGVKKGTYALPAGKMASTIKPRLGRNLFGLPGGAHLDGRIDDVRLFSVALPCE